ncbi:uncharacterized protein LOC128180273 [Crassostrea angulata]|uniref:uncharacterized protein LOC128180273 n=1 Tax=Magallana angulata TaxID=2784310 RepID=UPI0022B12CE7|nr:uncharacterized protein LOC128180273 [Crassostrea angulata]
MMAKKTALNHLLVDQESVQVGEIESGRRRRREVVMGEPGDQQGPEKGAAGGRGRNSDQRAGKKRPAPPSGMRRKKNQKEKAGGERGVLLGKTGPQLEVSLPLGTHGEAEGRIEYHRGMVVIVEDLENAEEMIEILEEVEMIVILEEGEMTEIEILVEGMIEILVDETIGTLEEEMIEILEDEMIEILEDEMIKTEILEEEMIVTLEIVVLLVKTETLETEELHLEKTVGDLIVIGRVSLIELLPEKKETGVEVVDGKTDGEEVVVVVKNAAGAMHGETAVRRMEEMKEVEEGPGEEAELEETAGERGPERKRDGAGEMTEDQQERTEDPQERTEGQGERTSDVVRDPHQVAKEEEVGETNSQKKELSENLRERKMMDGPQCVIDQTDKPRHLFGGG